MSKSLFELKKRQAQRGYSPRGGSYRPRPRRSTGVRFLRVCQYIFLFVAIACLGRFALSYFGAQAFQSYQSWRFDHVVHAGNPSSVSPWMRWIDKTLEAVLGAPPANPGPERTQPQPPAGARPSVPVLPAGSVIGRMEVPKLGISVMVLEGDSDDVLGKAAGHIPTTGLPGGQGNVVVAGHRDTFFRALRKIRKDDEIAFTTTQGTYYYHVGSIDKVGPQDVQVLHPQGHPTLTLITCYPFNYIGPAPMRFIVQASETQFVAVNKPDALFPHALPALARQSKVKATVRAHPPTVRLVSEVTPAEPAPTRTASSATRKNRTAAQDADPAPKADKNDLADASSDQAPPPHKRFGRLRAWLSGVPHHVHLTTQPATTP